ncbi:MAG: cysteine peptidase family C39 domain-containing protein, partial [Planctomycetales bacterium]
MIFRKNTVYTPTLLQIEAVECGAASLGILLGYHGRFVPLAQLRQECGVSRDGSKASNILKAARKHNLKAKGFSKPIGQLAKVKAPFIVFWQFNHFLVVEGFSKEFVYLNDPAMGHRKISLDEFDEGYTGVALIMEPDPETFQKQGRPSSALPGLWDRMKGNLLPFFFVFVAGVLLVLPGVAVPTLTRIFLDAVIVDGRYGWFRPLLTAMVVVLVLQVTLRAMQMVYLRRLQMGLSA